MLQYISINKQCIQLTILYYILVILNKITILGMLRFSNTIIANFAKWSKPKPKLNKIKQSKKSFAIGDQKAAKLSKSEQELENKQKALEQQKIEEITSQKIKVSRMQSIELQQYKSPQELEKIRISQYFYLKGQTVSGRKITGKQNLATKNAQIRLDQFTSINQKTNQRTKRQLKHGNYLPLLNKKYKGEINPVQPNLAMRRTGSLGIKLGMTTMWNKWGHIVPVTAIELDRVQIIQHKEPRHHSNYWQVQIGIGQKNMKRISKSLLGHFVKARVPPKRILAEFPVSQECLLPVGYMMSARHYTPGMFVDVLGKTVGHGFQGTIKRFGFRRQPQSHGNSLTTRVLGSTGCRQDPGRVFKGKKMYGRMGGKVTTQNGLQVFKIDVDKNIIYVKGSIPGKPGVVVKIKDTLIPSKLEKNFDLVEYPTFIEQKGVKYARQFSMYCGERDSAQIEIHDNAFIVNEGAEEKGGVAENKQSKDTDE